MKINEKYSREELKARLEEYLAETGSTIDESLIGQVLDCVGDIPLEPEDNSRFYFSSPGKEAWERVKNMDISMLDPDRWKKYKDMSPFDMDRLPFKTDNRKN